MHALSPPLSRVGINSRSHELIYLVAGADDDDDDDSDVVSPVASNGAQAGRQAKSGAAIAGC